MEEYADAKWNLPGWGIEQRYATDVLIGNWNEERRVVGKNFQFTLEHFADIPRAMSSNSAELLTKKAKQTMQCLV